MAFQRRSGAGWVTPASITRRSGGSWVGVSWIRRRQGSSWIDVLSAGISVTANPVNEVYSFVGTRPPASRTMTGISTAVVSGSTNYSIQWSFDGGDAMTTSDPTSLSTTFSASVPRGASRSATWTVTATDNVTGLSASTTIAVVFSYII